MNLDYSSVMNLDYYCAGSYGFAVGLSPTDIVGLSHGYIVGLSHGYAVGLSHGYAAGCAARLASPIKSHSDSAAPLVRGRRPNLGPSPNFAPRLNGEAEPRLTSGGEAVKKMTGGVAVMNMTKRYGTEVNAR